MPKQFSKAAIDKTTQRHKCFTGFDQMENPKERDILLFQSMVKHLFGRNAFRWKRDLGGGRRRPPKLLAYCKLLLFILE